VLAALDLGHRGPKPSISEREFLWKDDAKHYGAITIKSSREEDLDELK
jgi:hypothetical protein